VLREARRLAFVHAQRQQEMKGDLVIMPMTTPRYSVIYSLLNTGGAYLNGRH